MPCIPFAIGKPPRPEEWRLDLDAVARTLAAGLCRYHRGDRALARRVVLRAAREALGDTPGDPDIPGMIVDRGVLDQETLAVAEALRLTLSAAGLDHAEPALAESAMAIVQRALDATLGRTRRPKL